MKKLFTLGILLLASASQGIAQECSKFIDHNFDTETSLPTGWVEGTTTTGHLYLQEGAMVMERKAVGTKYPSPKAILTMPAVGDHYEVEYSFSTSTAPFTNRLDLLSADGKYLLSFGLGTKLNDLTTLAYGASTDGAKPTFSADRTLATSITAHTDYTITIKVKAGNLADIYLNGVQKVTDYALPTVSVAKLQFDFNSTAIKTGLFYLDHLSVFNGSRENTYPLRGQVLKAQRLLANAVIGEASGEYPQAAANHLTQSINTAKERLAACLTAEEITTAANTLTGAITTFEDSKVCSSDDAILVAKVATANALLEGASIGNAVGQYTQAVADKFEAAITQAESFVGSCAAQNILDEQISLLEAAQSEFEANVNPDLGGVSCDKLVNETFASVVLPSTWAEDKTKTDGHIYAKDGKLVFERISVNGSIKSPTGTKTLPIGVEESYEVAFDFAFDEHNVNTRVDYVTSDGKYIFSLKLGDNEKFNITYAYNEDGTKFTATFLEENKLMDKGFQKDTYYNIVLKFKTGNKLDVIIDGDVKLSDLSVCSTQVANVTYMFNAVKQVSPEVGKFFVDNFTVFKGERTAAHFALEQLARATQVFLDQAPIGDAAGNYTQANADILQAAITKTFPIATDCALTEGDLALATTTLQDAIAAFEATADCSVDESILSAAITAAETKVNAAVAGAETGQYPQASIDAFKASIAAAQAVIGTCATQEEVDAAVATLGKATITFDESMITCTTDTTALEEVLTTVGTFLEGAGIGDGAGLYPQTAFDALQAVITASETMIEDCATQEIVTAQVGTLTTALETFKAAKDCSVNETTLSASITTAQNTLKGASIGSAAGEYPQASADQLQAVIDECLSLIGTCATQSVIDGANTLLVEAINTFNASKNPELEDLVCGPMVTQDFEGTGLSLPQGWQETNTAGQVYLENGRMVAERKGTGSIKSPRPVYTMPSNVGEDYEVEFSYSASKNTFGTRVDFVTANGKYLLSLKLGDKGSATYALTTDGSKPATFETTHLLFDGVFQKEIFHTLTLKFKSNNKFDIYADQQLKMSNLALPSVDQPLYQIKFDFNSVYDKVGLFYLGHFGIFKGDRPNMSSLMTKIEEIDTFLREEVVIGNAGGQYPQASVDALKKVLEETRALTQECGGTEADVIDALETLETSFGTLKSDKVIVKTDVTLTIDMQTLLAKKDPLWFGGNNTYNNAGQGLWNVDGNHANYDVIDMANYTGATFYRFPGGTMANLYRWKRAIGAKEERIPNLNAHGDAGPFTNEFGPDEFGNLLQTTPLNKGIIVVGFQYETPQDAADYVEYMNTPVGQNPNGGIAWAEVRAKNGSYDPYNVELWEIGNELYGDWELNVFNYPASGDDVRGGENILKGNAKYYVNSHSREFTNQLACLDSSWLPEHSVTTLAPSQEFYVKFAPVDISASFVLKINNQTWTKVADFTASTATDLHYTVEPVTGKITFGDGVKGMIPEAGHNIVLNYTSGPHHRFTDYYEAMKAVDPSIKVISCFEVKDFYRLMAENNEPYDGVAKHYYPSDEVDAEDLYEIHMVNALNYKTKIEEHKTLLEEYPNTSLEGKEVKQYLTEFGTSKETSSVAFASILFHDVINYHADDMGGILVHSFFKNDNTPMVDTRNQLYTAKAFAYHIFTHLHQEQFVKVNYEGDAYTFKGTNVNKTYATASINEDKTILTIVVPNTTDDEILNTSINISNYPFASDAPVQALKWLVTSEDKFAYNSSKTPDAVYMTAPEVFTAAANFKAEVPPFSTAVYQFALTDKVDLSELKEDVTAGLVGIDQGLSSEGKLMVNGIEYEKGLALFDQSTVTYNVANNFQTFEASIGLDDAFTSGALEVNIYGDDQVIYTATFAPNTPTENISINLQDIQTLRIESKSVSGSGVHLILGNARLTEGEGYTHEGDITGSDDTLTMSVAPNPFDQYLRLQLSEPLSGQVMLYNIMGQKVFEKQVEKKELIELGVGNLHGGVYILHFRTADKTFVAKVLKN